MMQTFIEVSMTIGRDDEARITNSEMDGFIDTFLEWLEAAGYECAAGWKLVDEDGEVLKRRKNEQRTD